MADAREGLLYTPRHMWVKLDEEASTAEVGITEELARRLTTILSIDSPMPGDELEIDTDCLHIHLSTGIRALYAPMTGRVIETNQDVLDNPDLMQVAPYEHCIFKMEYDEPGEVDLLLSPTRYAIYLDEY